MSCVSALLRACGPCARHEQIRPDKIGGPANVEEAWSLYHCSTPLRQEPGQERMGLAGRHLPGGFMRALFVHAKLLLFPEIPLEEALWLARVEQELILEVIENEVVPSTLLLATASLIPSQDEGV